MGIKIDGMRQSVLYGSSSETLYFHLRSLGADLALGESDECNVWIYSTGGDLLLSNQAMTDDGSGWFYIEVDASQWILGSGYRAKIVATVDSKNYTFQEYFDVAAYPINEPLISSTELDKIHPEWQHIRSTSASGWTDAIYHSHAELCNDISRLRDKEGELIYPYRMIDHNQLRWAELLYLEHHCVENLIRAPQEERQFYRERKAVAFNELASIFIDDDDNLMLDEDEEAQDVTISMRR